MDRRRFLLRRGSFALLAAWIVVTLSYALIELSPDPNISAVIWNAAAHAGGMTAEEARAAYLASHGGNVGPVAKYVDWLWGVVTLRWGYSYGFGKPVLDVLLRHLRVTALYLVPALVLSVVVGTAYGVYSATHRGSLPDRIGEVSVYLGFGIPNVFLAAALPPLLARWKAFPNALLPPQSVGGYVSISPGLLERMLRAYSSVTPDLLASLLLPVLVLSTTLVAGIAHYTRSETADRFGEQYVKLVRAKGAADRRVARHVLRNAALPLVALTYSEFLAVVALHVFVVEAVFGIPGFGMLLFAAIRARDVPVVLGGTFIVVFAGILGNFLQDVLAVALDPRLQD